jgi:hypothetical protein
MNFIKKTSLLLLLCLIVFSSCCEKQNSDKPKESTITKERAIQLQKEYINTRANAINKHLYTINHFREKIEPLKNNDQLIEDVRDVTFDIETLKQYIAYVEKEGAKKGYKDLSLRVYFGAYPKNDKDSRIKTPGYSTVFFMPTHKPQHNESAARSFYFNAKDQIIDGVDGLNFGNGTPPPHNIN